MDIYEIHSKDAIDYLEKSHAIEVNTDEERHHDEVLDYAIRHIQAWDKVKEELNERKKGIGIYATASDYQLMPGLYYALSVIDKHLQGVDK